MPLIEKERMLLKQNVPLSAMQVLGQEPELPAYYAQIWHWFLELHQARSVGLNGANPLAYADIYAWSKLHQLTLKRWEIASLQKIDQWYLEEARKEEKTTTT